MLKTKKASKRIIFNLFKLFFKQLNDFNEFVQMICRTKDFNRLDGAMV